MGLGGTLKTQLEQNPVFQSGLPGKQDQQLDSDTLQDGLWPTTDCTAQGALRDRVTW